MELKIIKVTGYEGIDSLDDSSDYLVAKYTAWREEFKGRMQPVADPNCAWVVYAGTEAQRPQAAFSNKECADQLVLYMQGASDPVLRERSQIKAMSIVVDRYQEQICFGKMPYEIILNSQGEVSDSWGPSDGIPAIEEPVIMNEKLHALAGTFWGWTGRQAIVEAQQLFNLLRDKGEI